MEHHPWLLRSQILIIVHQLLLRLKLVLGRAEGDGHDLLL